MARGGSAREPLAHWDVVPPRAEGVDTRRIIGVMLGYGDKLSPPFTKSMVGAFAGLLVAKWAGYDEAEREAVAAFEGRAFVPELPEALRRSAWKRPIRTHANAVVEALKGMTSRHAAVSPFTRYLVDVAPLVTSAAEQAASFVTDLLQWVQQVETDSPVGREVAAGVLDETLRHVAGRDWQEIGECATPAPVADLMLELANPVRWVRGFTIHASASAGCSSGCRPPASTRPLAWSLSQRLGRTFSGQGSSAWRSTGSHTPSDSAERFWPASNVQDSSVR